ncbi:phosphatidate cytidylyltransferase [Malonomonas rubra]|uniref:phosphatidate cytidylyltransferase n=1 Tax=Malonomonas rubra TaxID=57040 RepID=UPI0026EB27B8|nr:phosphatidate cytidylyltransferase [Malonomonas rubra]
MTAAVVIPLLILLVAFANSLIFSLFLAVVLFLALIEFNRMGLAENNVVEQWVAAGAGALSIPLLYMQRHELLLPLFGGAILILGLFFLFRFSELSAVHHRLGWLCLGFFYLPFLVGHLVELRYQPNGRAWIFLTLLVIMVCDSCAYFVGSKLGKHKLYPAVSPNKSVEGGVGGLLGSVLVVELAGLTFLPMIGVWDGIAVGLLLGVVGQLGDLFESLLKRACGVKDSGTLIPGHGGLLDRLDSLLFAFPVVYCLARYGYGG